VSRSVVRRTTGGRVSRARTLPPVDSSARFQPSVIQRATCCIALRAFPALPVPRPSATGVRGLPGRAQASHIAPPLELLSHPGPTPRTPRPAASPDLRPLPGCAIAWSASRRRCDALRQRADHSRWNPREARPASNRRSLAHERAPAQFQRSDSNTAQLPELWGPTHR
jgi:hypothetical protein